MKLVIFGFKPIRKSGHNISQAIVDSLTIGEKILLESDTKAIDTWLESLTHEISSMRILGLGEYRFKDMNELRLEAVCTNKFKNEYLDYPYKIKKELRGFLKPNGVLKKTSGIGNSFCNYASYHLMKLINFKKIVAKYSFIHVPKTYNKDKAVEIITNELSRVCPDCLL